MKIFEIAVDVCLVMAILMCFVVLITGSWFFLWVELCFGGLMVLSILLHELTHERYRDR